MFNPVIVGAETLRKSFEAIAELSEKTKSNTPPTNQEEAISWVNSAPDAESRKARKALSHGMRYGIGTEGIKNYLKGIDK